MGVALVTRSVVEHLGVWAPDRDAPTSVAGLAVSGRYVTVCGSERNHGPWHPTSHVSHGRDRLLRIKALLQPLRAAPQRLPHPHGDHPMIGTHLTRPDDTRRTPPLDTTVREVLTDRDLTPDARARIAAEVIAASAVHLPAPKPFVWHRWLGGVVVQVSA